MRSRKKASPLSGCGASRLLGEKTHLVHCSFNHISFLGKFWATVTIGYYSCLFIITLVWYSPGRLLFLPWFKEIAYSIVHTQLSIEKSGKQIKWFLSFKEKWPMSYIAWG